MELFEHTHRLDPTQFKEFMTMATANTAALTSIAASLATVAQAAVSAIDNPTGDTAATVSAVAAAVTSLTATEAALQNALTPPTDTFTFSPATIPTPVAGQSYSQAVSATGIDGAATLTVPSTSTLPAGATFDGVTLAWPDPVSGTYSFDIVATDAAGVTATLSTSWNF
jgi:hypothetical protein